MDTLSDEQRQKEKHFVYQGAISTMLFSFIVEIIFAVGSVYRFLFVPSSVIIITAACFLFGLIMYVLNRRNVHSWFMSFLITTCTAAVVTFALGSVSPIIRVPFFLIYLYIVLHPSFFLGIINGLYAILFIDVAYLIMIFTTQSKYPETVIGLEIVKLFIFSFISIMLIIDFNSMLSRVKNMRRIIQKAEDGDLTVRFNDQNKDEISFLSLSVNRILDAQTNIIKLIIEIVHSLSAMSEQIAATASEMASSTSEIVQTTQRMTEGINSQFNELDKTIDTGKNLSELSYSIVNDVKKIEDFSVGVSDSASGAISQSDVVINNIELIGKRYGNLTALLAKLGDISLTINKIVNTIDSISEKINILSLNASIEAARAGEYGRGFSIVADEVKKLADSSQVSAAEISRIIKDMMESIKTVSETTNDVNRAIEDGSIVVKSTADSLTGISNRVIELNQLIRNIKEMISKEEGSITSIIQQVEISHNVAKDNSAAAQQILASIQEQSAATEEFSAASEELLSVLNRLKEITQKFKLEKSA